MVHPGLYICDASLIPCSVGINPSFTIATSAEYVSKHLLQDVLKHKRGLKLLIKTHILSLTRIQRVVGDQWSCLKKP